MMTIPIKKITRDDNSVANVPDYEGNWPIVGSLLTRSDNENYIVYMPGDEAELADYLASLPPPVVSESPPEPTKADLLAQLAALQAQIEALS